MVFVSWVLSIYLFFVTFNNLELGAKMRRRLQLTYSVTVSILRAEEKCYCGYNNFSGDRNASTASYYMSLLL